MSIPRCQHAVPGGSSEGWPAGPTLVSMVAYVHPLVLNPCPPFGSGPSAAAERPNTPLPDPRFTAGGEAAHLPRVRPGPGPQQSGCRFPRARGEGDPSVPVWFGRAPAEQASSAPACDFWGWFGLYGTAAPEVGEDKGLGVGPGSREEWGWREAGVLYRPGKQAQGAVRPVLSTV